MLINIVTVGNKPPSSIEGLIAEFTKRFPRTISITWQFLKHGPGDANTSKHHESENILKSLPKNGLMVLLDETGVQYTSENFSKLVFNDSRDVTFIIGGAYGVDDTVKNAVDITLSLSQLVFPHQLVRLLLTEQLYRAYTISINHPYHHS